MNRAAVTSLVLAVAMAVCPHGTKAQQARTIRGTVTAAETGAPLARATVSVVGTPLSALTDGAGRAAGVLVVQNNGAPGSSPTVRIRGGNSFIGGNDPLYVVDGLPVGGSALTAVNPDDVESMEVLKDAAATAIYGARGANGVVLI